ncbi:tyrosine-type recombinase/integrase [Streptomyces klenkii]|uniref:tyrosine-type recombinase/integrase n=1 Tax=Streptomyces klenkii TaxID=1420899 RepID=UPI0036E4C96E
MSLTTARECAARWGIGEVGARRVLATLTPADRDPVTGAMRYRQEEADAARASRPGRGHRADLSTEAVTAEQFHQLVNDEAIPASHRALWILLWEGNVRVGDALSLDVRDADLDGRTIVLDYPKLSSGEHVAPISDDAAELIRAVMDGRTEGPLIANRQGGPIGREGAARAARTFAKVNIHAFRLGGQKDRAKRAGRHPE